MKKIGKLKVLNSSEISKSYVSIGFECLDRDLFKPEMCYDLLSKTGVKYARCQTGWAKCETKKGIYNFEWLDSIVDNLLKRDIIPWFNLGYGNPIYMPDVPNPTGVGCVPIYYGDEAFKAWCDFVEALTKHYRGRITHYEIWNEPDISEFWYPAKSNGVEYAKFVNLSSKIIKKCDPKAKTGMSTSTPYCFDFIKDTLDNVVSSSLDFFSFHAYSTIPEYRYPQVVKYLRTCLNERGFTNTELWQGEAGYPSWAYKGHWLVKDGFSDEHAQAVWQLRRFFLDVYNGIKLSSFFQMADMWEKVYEKVVEVLDKPAAHGILNGKVYTPKKSYETISNLAAIFSGDIIPTSSYIHVDISCDLVTELLCCQTMTFRKNNTPIYAYYLPLKLSEKHNITHTADIFVEYPINDPILIDPYTGEVFAVEYSENIRGITKYKGLPLREYPMVIANMIAFEIDTL